MRERCTWALGEMDERQASREAAEPASGFSFPTYKFRSASEQNPSTLGPGKRGQRLVVLRLHRISLFILFYKETLAPLPG